LGQATDRLSFVRRVFVSLGNDQAIVTTQWTLAEGGPQFELNHLAAWGCRAKHILGVS